MGKRVNCVIILACNPLAHTVGKHVPLQHGAIAFHFSALAHENGSPADKGEVCEKTLRARRRLEFSTVKTSDLEKWHPHYFRVKSQDLT